MTLSMGIVRKIDELGRITIMKEARELLGINQDDPLEFFIDENNYIMMKKYTGSGCFFCGTIEGTIPFKGKFVCSSCIEDSRNELLHPGYIENNEFAATKEDVKRRNRKNETEQLVIMLLNDFPQMKQKDIALELGISVSYVSQIMKSFRSI